MAIADENTLRNPLVRIAGDAAERACEAPWRAVSGAAVVLRRLLGGRAAGRLGILTYHRVAPNTPGLPRPYHNVTPDRFAEQLRGLSSRGYRFWSLKQTLQCHATGDRIPSKTVVITFDDGYGCVYQNAWPVLRELKIPATIFVSTAFLDGGEPFPFDAWGAEHAHHAPAESYRPLTSEQCRKMVADGLITLGPHTHTHQDFRSRPSDFEQDLRTSIEVLQSRFGADDLPFAFPFGCPYKGFAGDELVGAAKRAGVSCALTTEAVLVDPRSDPMRWGRMNVFDWDTASTLDAKLQGWYSWAPKFRRWLAQRAACLPSLRVARRTEGQAR